MNTVVLSVAKAVLFRPLGFETPDRLMWIRLLNTQTGIIEDRLSWRDIDDIREFTQSFESLAAFGLLPALRQSRVEAAESLRTGTRTTDGRQILAWQQGLLIGQIAVVLVLLEPAGMLLESFRRLMGQDLGYKPQSVIAIDLSTWGFPTNEETCRLYRPEQPQHVRTTASGSAYPRAAAGALHTAALRKTRIAVSTTL